MVKPKTKGPIKAVIKVKPKVYNNSLWFTIVFFLINIVLSAYFIDIWLTPNGTSRALPVLTLYDSNSLVIDKYKNFTGDISRVGNHYYSDKAPFSSFLTYPFYYGYRKAGLPEFDSTTILRYPIYIWEDGGLKDGRTFISPKISTALIFGGLVSGTLPFVLIILITFLAIRKFSSASPVLLAMLPYYGTFVFVYSGTFFGHILAAFFLIFSYYLITEKKGFFFAGFSIGLAFATEYTIAIIIPFWILQIWMNEKRFSKVLLFVIGAFPGGLIVLLYNFLITGSPLTLLYTYVAHEQYQNVSNLGFGYPKPAAIWGLLFSLSRGLIFYAPILIFLLVYFIKYAKNEHYAKWKKSYLFSASILYLLLISSHLMWTGGWSYGPRHLIPVTVLLLFEGIRCLSRNPFSQTAFMLISGAGLLCSWLAKSTKLYMLPDWPIYPNPLVNIIIPNFTSAKFNTNNLGVWLLDASPGFSILLWIILCVASLILLYILNSFTTRVPKH